MPVRTLSISSKVSSACCVSDSARFATSTSAFLNSASRVDHSRQQLSARMAKQIRTTNAPAQIGKWVGLRPRRVEFIAKLDLSSVPALDRKGAELQSPSPIRSHGAAWDEIGYLRMMDMTSVLSGR